MFVGERDRRLVARQRFAGQRGFLCRERVRCAKARVGGHDCARFEQHDVANNDFALWHAHGLAVAANERGGWQQRAQRSHRAVGAQLLRTADACVDRDDREDQRGVRGVARCRRERCGCEQHENERIAELAQQRAEDGARRRFAQRVLAVFQQASLRFVGGQSLLRMDAERLRHRGCVEREDRPLLVLCHAGD